MVEAGTVSSNCTITQIDYIKSEIYTTRARTNRRSYQSLYIQGYISIDCNPILKNTIHPACAMSAIIPRRRYTYMFESEKKSITFWREKSLFSMLHTTKKAFSLYFFTSLFTQLSSVVNVVHLFVTMKTKSIMNFDEL